MANGFCSRINAPRATMHIKHVSWIKLTAVTFIRDPQRERTRVLPPKHATHRIHNSNQLWHWFASAVLTAWTLLWTEAHITKLPYLSIMHLPPHPEYIFYYIDLCSILFNIPTPPTTFALQKNTIIRRAPSLRVMYFLLAITAELKQLSYILTNSRVRALLYTRTSGKEYAVVPSIKY